MGGVIIPIPILLLRDECVGLASPNLLTNKTNGWAEHSHSLYYEMNGGAGIPIALLRK